MPRRTGSRPNTTRPSAERGTGAAHGMLVVGLEVEPAIELGHLLAVAIEHQGRPPFDEQTALADPPLGRLAPARMVDSGIDVGIKAVFARVLHVPGAGRLRLGQRYAHDRLDPLEAVLPGYNQPDRSAVLVGQGLAIEADRKIESGCMASS